MRRIVVAVAVVALAVGAAVLGRTDRAAASVLTNCTNAECTYDYSSAVSITCFTPRGFGTPGETCRQPYSTTVQTSGRLNVGFQAARNNCSDISVQFSVDGAVRYTSPFLPPGGVAGGWDFGPVSAGDHTVSLVATGRVGGCNTGVLRSWSGVAHFQVSDAVRYQQYGIAVNCTSTGQLCTPAYQVAVSTARNIFVRFTASPQHCSNINAYVSVDGTQYYSLYNMSPGATTGYVQLNEAAAGFGAFSAGTHTVSVQAEGITGGCNYGRLTSWTGTLEVWTSQ